MNPNDKNHLPQSVPFRETDVLVAGAGPAGIAAALAAARTGARTLLVERFGRIGGAAVTSLVNPLMGGIASPLVEEIETALAKVGGDWELLDLVYYDLLEKAGVELLLHSWVAGPVMEGPTVRGVRILCKEGLLELRAQVVVDATADGDVAFGAGVPFEQGRTGDGLLQPMSIMFRLGGVDKQRGLLCGSEEQARIVTVPEGRWSEVCERAAATGELPANVTIVRLYESPMPGERIVNATQVNYVDGTKVADLTRAEIEGRRQSLQVRDFLRRHAPGYEECRISHLPAAVGVRETRRFLGENYLDVEDLLNGRQWPDAVVREACFVVDIHNPNGGGQAHGVAARVQPYDIPYGCLVPRVVEGLVLAGRCISGSHEAHASYRVQRILLGVGAAAGAAAGLSAQAGVAPRRLSPVSVQKALGLRPAVGIS